jgi:hypothetical protein
MINKIIDGISISLNAEFGDDYKIYTESIEQGLKEPCFSIVCVNPTNELFRGKKYFRKNLFCIQYFPKGEDKRSECMDVLERMFDCLEVIKAGEDLQRGTSMHGEVVDQVLNFFVNYDMFVYKVESTDAMETMDLTSNVKG